MGLAIVFHLGDAIAQLLLGGRLALEAGDEDVAPFVAGARAPVLVADLERFGELALLALGVVAAVSAAGTGVARWAPN